MLKKQTKKEQKKTIKSQKLFCENYFTKILKK